MNYKLVEHLAELFKKNIVIFCSNSALKVKDPEGNLGEADKRVLRDNKGAILDFFSRQCLSSNAQLGPLSLQQQRLWLIEKIEPEKAQYNLPGILALKGKLDVVALENSIRTIFNRHDVLRSIYFEEGDTVYQLVRDISEDQVVALVDLSELLSDEQSRKVKEITDSESRRVFDLVNELPLQAKLIQQSSTQSTLLLTMHHICGDAWSSNIVFEELSALYAAYSQGSENPLSELSIQYSDYAEWQRDWLKEDVVQQDLDYWINRLSDVPQVHGLTLDKPRPSIQDVEAGHYWLEMDAELRLAMEGFCQTHKVTLFILLQTVFSCFLHRYSGQDDIVMGTPVANRHRRELADLIGFFVNTLALRANLSDNPKFSDLLKSNKVNLLDDFEHQQLPFELLIEKLQPERSVSFSPLFQIMFVFQSHKRANLHLPGLDVCTPQQGYTASKFDLTLEVIESEDGAVFHWEYASALFDESTIKRMASHFLNLLNAAMESPDGCINSLPLMSENERHQLLVQWNDTAADYPKDKCIHELFELQAQKNPDAVAVIFEDQSLSYDELNTQANRLAHYLMTEKQVVPDTLVGICVERSPEMVVGILAILKAGGAYVPLDPEYPEARLQYMLDDAKLTTVLTQSHLRDITPVTDEQSVCLGSESLYQHLQSHQTVNPNIQLLGLNSGHLAYVIYTSGSTGKPKGVMVEHSGLVNRIHWMDSHYGSSSSDRILQKTPFSFDVSVWEFVWPLSVGARIVLAKPSGHKDPTYLSELIREQGITKLHFVPSMLSSMLALGDLSQCTSVKQVFCSGEALSLTHVENFKASCSWSELHNLYGPTEAAIDVSYWDCSQSLSGLSRVPIGRPINNIQLHVLDQHLKVQPEGVAGELHIGGVGLARGYLNQADLSAERFIGNPFYDKSNAASSERLYKTGDLVRWLPDGNLEFLGRIDYQVKIRGFRIELGEIENTLMGFDRVENEVKDAVVMAKDSSTGDKYLAAYVVVDDAKNINANANERSALMEQFRLYLGQGLPDYMVPSVFVFLDALPLTPNGKVDRKSLPEPDATQQQNDYIAPCTETEKTLCEIWQDVLGVERVGVSDNFFHLGGHSLLATRLVAQINAVLNVSVPIKTVFVAQTLESLAHAVFDLEKGVDRPLLLPVSREHSLLPSYAQQRLWLLDKIDGSSAHYNMPSALKLNGTLNLDALTLTFSHIFERHESLRTCFFVGDDGQPRQCIQTAQPFVIQMTNLSSLDVTEQERQLTTLIDAESRCIFDLSRDLMLRSQCIKLAENQHVLLVTMHHIASDGWSIQILTNEISALYSAFVHDQESPLAPLAIQYADYAHWQRHWLQGEVLSQQITYWTTQLRDLPVAHSVPLDHTRPKMQTFAGAVYTSQIDSATTSALKTLCQSHGATVFMGLHAVFSVLLSRYSNETDIVIGSPIANREQSEIEHLIGFFVNTLVLRSDLSDQPSFTSLLNQIKATLLDAYAHQQVPFEQIVEHLQPERNLSHSPLFQIMLVLHNNENSLLDLPELTLSPIGQDWVVAKYDLTLNVSDGNEGLQMDWEFNTDVFDPETIKRMAGHFETLTQALVALPDENVFSAQMLSSTEHHQLLVEWNDTAAYYPKDTCIHELFEAQVEKNSDAVAVIFEGQQLSYGELNKKANQLAHYLVDEREVKPDTLVGICIERSLDMVVGILAILKAGGAYVPLDPEYPEARLQYMLDDTKLTTALTKLHLRGNTPINDAQALYIDDSQIQQQLSMLSTANIQPDFLKLHNRNLAYVIYTSGSTGNPKGSLLTHRGLCNLALMQKNDLKVSSDSRVLQFASLSFDAATFEFCMALPQGGALILPSNRSVKSPDELSEIVMKHRVTHATLPPALLPLLDINKWNSVETLIAAGETCSKQLALRWSQGRIFINAYGPSEATVCSTMGTFKHGQSILHIGKPIQNTQVYVFGKNNLVPIGVAGELYIGGVGLSRGYLNRSNLTEINFIPNPFSDKENLLGSERLYKTGDLVRWLPDGNLEFLGRIDNQVKIRGFRIELGEIENTLMSYSDVKNVVVLAKEDEAGNKYIAAYVAVESVTAIEGNGNERSVFIEQLRQYLSQRLADYMIPAAFVFLEALPLTSNGKVDRKALPEPDVSVQQNDYIAPRTETEKVLCEIWQDVLGVERVGVSDNFFHLGGHSLLVMQVISRARQYCVDIIARQFFVHPTLADLAADINDSVKAVVFVAPVNGIPDSCDEITLDMLPLVKQGAENIMQEEITQCVAQVPGGAPNVQDIYPLAALQEGILFHHMMKPDEDPYVLSMLFDIHDVSVFKEFLEGLQFIVDRHDVMRTVIIWRDISQPLQVVCRKAKLSVTWLTLDAKQNDIEMQMRARCKPENLSMNLEEGPLLRLQVAVDETTGRHIVLLMLHHIILDHVALEVIQHELMLYKAGKVRDLPTPIGYREFVAHAQHQAKHHDADKFFYSTLGDIDTPTTPFNLLNVNGDGGRIIELKAAVSDALSVQIRALAKTLMMSPAVLFHASWAMVVSACSARDDVVFGTVMSGRLQGTVDAENMLGVFINTLPLRVKLDDTHVIDFVRQVQTSLMELVPYEQASLALAQNCSGISGDAPLFSAMLNYRHSVAPVDESGASAPDDVQLLVSQERTNYPFNLSVDDWGDGFSIEAQVDRSVGAERVIGYVQTALSQLVEALSSAPDNKVKSLSILPESERHQLLVEWNDTAADYPKDTCIHELFEAQVEKNSDAVAVIFEEQQLSYGELNKKSNQLAHYLVEEREVKPDTLVGICVERSLDMVVGILAILKAGGAYVSLDPEYPEARLQYMLDDAKLNTVLTQSYLRDTTPVSDEQAVCLDSEDLRQYLQNRPTRNLNTQVLGLSTGQLAYVIYTSGSTGNPKGVMVEQRNLVNFISTMQEKPGISSDDCLLAVTSICFDIHGLEIFLPLISGAKLVVASTVAASNPECLLELMTNNHVTFMQATPVTWKMLVDLDWPSKFDLKVLCGGEALSHSLAMDLLNKFGVEIWNMYGPTETTIWSAIKQLHLDDVNILMGKPVANTKIYISSDCLNLSPVGVEGELYISGEGLARGYLNQEDLSAEKFIPNPFYSTINDLNHERIYKTGDLARWLPDGNLEFLGRIDHQVKIRGFRIELGEIENTLIDSTEVKDAVVLARKTDNDDKQLVAYITIENVARVDESETKRSQFILRLREYLSQSLPDYMLPSFFVLLESFPLTQNGKIDRKAFPEPQLSLSTETEFSPPSTDIERILAKCWAMVLSVDVDIIDVNSSFFDMGGNSISTMATVAKARAQNINYSAKDIFECKNIHNLAQRIESSLSYTELVNEHVLPDSNIDETSCMFHLTPAKAKFFAQNRHSPHHWNASKLLLLPHSVSLKALEEAVDYVMNIHDGLRSEFVKYRNNWMQQISILQRGHYFTRIVVPPINVNDREKFVAEKSEGFQGDLSLTKGLIHFYYFDFLDGGDTYLSIVVNHLIVDGYSLSILFEDIIKFCDCIESGEEINISDESITVCEWSKISKSYADSQQVKGELPYWAGLPLVDVTNIPVDYPEYRENNGSLVLHQVTNILSVDETKDLECNIPKIVYGAQLIDVLNTALMQTLNLWTGNNTQMIEQIRSGRDDLLGGIDTSRVVDFMIRTYPSVLTLENSQSSVENLNSVKKQLQEIPNMGAGFGLLKYLNEGGETNRVMNEFNQPEIELNFLGSFDAKSIANKFKDIGYNNNVKNHENGFLEWKVFVFEKKLYLSCSSRASIFKKSTIEYLCNNFHKFIKEYSIMQNINSDNT
jgi:amino acid adenylation domain-containing protein/non-ribosomal peptide synthase protein (TIGR01720 family)